jgi:hypothetical protein
LPAPSPSPQSSHETPQRRSAFAGRSSGRLTTIVKSRSASSFTWRSARQSAVRVVTRDSFMQSDQKRSCAGAILRCPARVAGKTGSLPRSTSSSP